MPTLASEAPGRSVRRAAVDLRILARTLDDYRAQVPGRSLLVRLDADAFGHGLVPVARHLAEAGVERFSVSQVRDALLLREAGVTAPLLVQRLGAGADAGAVRAAHVEIVVSSDEELERVARSDAAGVHLAVDCGGAFAGVATTAVADAVTAASSRVRVTGLYGRYGRFAEPAAAEAAFAGVVSVLRGRDASPLTTSLHGTRGIDAGLGAQDMVRLGRGIYGIPSEGDAVLRRPALRFSGTVVSVKRVAAGEGVSYGYTWRAPSDGRLALVTGGYADGIPRALGNRARVAIGGTLRPVVGRVAMDVLMVDLGDAEALPGDEVVFFGDPASGEPSVADWAGATGFRAVEIVGRLGPRVERTYSR